MIVRVYVWAIVVLKHSLDLLRYSMKMLDIMSPNSKAHG